MRICVCAIMKNNHKYLSEWVHHYLSIGASKVIIYDNNDIADERNLKNYIRVFDRPYVEIVNWRSVWSGQLPAYEDCYNRYSKKFDWFGFFDSDEYLILNKWKNLEEMLEEFPDNDLLAINWLNYDDMGVIERDESIPVMKFFTHVADKWNDFFHYKQFIRSGIDGIELHQHNIVVKDPSLNLLRTNIVHSEIPMSEFITKEFHDEAFIKHVLTKTLKEYINEKAFNGKPTGVDDKTKGTSFGYFFEVNERTPEKEQVIEDFIEYRNSKLQYYFLLNPTYESVKKYSDNKYSVVITSEKEYHTFLNRVSRILIMPLKDASKRFPNLIIVK